MDDFDRYYNQALRFLTFRPRSEKEVRDNLLKKKTAQEIIDQVIEKLKEQKFLDDQAFVKWWTEQRTKFKPKSKRIIKMELRQKGVSDNDIAEGISDEGMDAELRRAQKIVESKIDKFKGLSKFELTQKLGPMLARRGFDYETIKKAIDLTTSK